MKIDKTDIIAGYPAIKIRDLLREGRPQSYMSISLIGDFLSLNNKQAKVVLDELIKLGLIEVGNDPNYPHRTHSITLEGNSLANKRFVPTISRERAEKHFSKFNERVREVNQNPKYLYKVAKVLLFGSFMKDAQFVNDIDLVLFLERKESDSKIFEQQSKDKVRHAIKAGKQFRSFVDELFYPQDEVLHFLKSRCVYLSFHKKDDGILDTVETKQIFP